MSSEVIACDPITQIQTIYHPSDDGRKYVMEEKQDVTEIVEANKYLYNQFDQKAPFKGDGFHRVASIPLTVLLDLHKKGLFRGAEMSKEDAAWLNDPDNKYFRTRPGRM